MTENETNKPVKYLEFRFTDGVYRVPAYIIARDRAAYYAGVDTGVTKGDEFDKAYQDEFVYTMSSDVELLDYVRNNMNWEDLEQDTFRVKDLPTVPHKQQWDKLSDDGEGLKIVSVAADPLNGVYRGERQ